VRTARRSIGKLSGQQPKTTAAPVDNDPFIDAGMAVRFTIRRFLLVTAAIAYALAAYLVFVREAAYVRDENAIIVKPIPNAPDQSQGR